MSDLVKAAGAEQPGYELVPSGPPYPADRLGEDQEDNGTMPENVEQLAEYVVGRRIVSALPGQIDRGPGEYPRVLKGLILTLDNSVSVVIADSSDCCAYTELEQFLLHPERVDHIITGVATTEGYTRWHIYADAGDVLELTVSWSSGNAFYYGYGFDIAVGPIEGEVIELAAIESGH
ncbi:DUF7448 domain-containing protein [Mycobacteroides abscessus]|uniref:DUF7448 domain-containing protein n=1 Tax=Mycobacteroides abscessus TaxID=36809 RepID=UPI000C268E18|nr:hypothetical protein [Mycobacteroides abscessus]